MMEKRMTCAAIVAAIAIAGVSDAFLSASTVRVARSTERLRTKPLFMSSNGGSTRG